MQRTPIMYAGRVVRVVKLGDEIADLRHLGRRGIIHKTKTYPAGVGDTPDDPLLFVRLFDPSKGAVIDDFWTEELGHVDCPVDPVDLETQRLALAQPDDDRDDFDNDYGIRFDP